MVREKMRFGNKDGSGVRVRHVTYGINDKRANYASNCIAYEQRIERRCNQQYRGVYGDARAAVKDREEEIDEGKTET